MADPIILPVAAWQPDLPALVGKASSNILNVYPRTSASYGAVPSPMAQYNALPSRCQGACGYKDSSANVHLFAGDATDLFEIKSGSTAWGSVTRNIAIPVMTTLSTSTTGGAIAAATTVYVTIAYTGTSANSAAPAPNSITTGSGSTNSIGVPSPPPSDGASGYDIYAGLTSGTQYLSNTGGPVAIGTAYTLQSVPDSGSQAPASASGTVPYTVGSDAQWQFTYFNGRLLATDFTDPVQSFTLGTSTAFADLATAAPRGRYIATIRNAFVVLANTFDPINGNMPQRVWWPAAGDPTNWPTPGSQSAAELQSGAADLLGDLGEVMGIAANLLYADALIALEYGFKLMQYAGPPAVFDFLPAQSGHGLLAPYSLVVDGGVAYGLSQDGFFSFDGSNFSPIGFNQVDKTVLADLDATNLSRVVGAVDVVNKLIWWAYPGAGNSNGNPNRLLCFNKVLGRWSLCEVTCETLMRLLSIGYTLDELYTVLGYTLDDLPAPLDSSLWTGGALQLGLFDSSHTVNFLSGTPLAATVETQELQPFPGRRTLVRNSRPYVDGVGSVPSVALGHRENMQANPAYGAPVAANSIGSCGVRGSGRYVRAQVTMPAGATSWTNISGVELDAIAQGSR